MRLFTVHAPLRMTAEAGDPARGRVAMVPEGFSLVAAIAPSVWLLWHRLWLALVLVVAGTISIAWLLPAAVFPWVLLAAQIVIGFHAQDLRRWTLSRQGLAEVAVVAGRDEETAMLRLLAARPDLAEGLGA